MSSNDHPNPKRLFTEGAQDHPGDGQQSRKRGRPLRQIKQTHEAVSPLAQDAWHQFHTRHAHQIFGSADSSPSALSDLSSSLPPDPSSRREVIGDTVQEVLRLHRFGEVATHLADLPLTTSPRQNVAQGLAAYDVADKTITALEQGLGSMTLGEPDVQGDTGKEPGKPGSSQDVNDRAQKRRNFYYGITDGAITVVRERALATASRHLGNVHKLHNEITESCEKIMLERKIPLRYSLILPRKHGKIDEDNAIDAAIALRDALNALNRAGKINKGQVQDIRKEINRCYEEAGLSPDHEESV